MVNLVDRCKLCADDAVEILFILPAGQVYRCRSCDLHFLDCLDEIDAIEANSKGLDEQAWNYIEMRIGEADALLPKRLALVKEFVELPGATCLDLGAGVGQFLVQLQKEQATGYGIEPSGVRRQYARRKYGLELRRELVDSEYWQSGFSASFDLICLWDVIEHVNFPRATLAAASRLLKPGGYLFLDTPSRETIAYRLSQRLYRLSRGQLPLALENFYSSAPYGHKQIFTRSQLQQLVAEANLQVCSLRGKYTSDLLPGDKLILACRKAE